MRATVQPYILLLHDRNFIIIYESMFEISTYDLPLKLHNI